MGEPGKEQLAIKLGCLHKGQGMRVCDTQGVSLGGHNRETNDLEMLWLLPHAGLPFVPAQMPPSY